MAGLCDSVKDGETGLLANAGDIDDLAAKILLVLNNSSLREQLGKKALIFSKEFSWDKTADEFMKILEESN